MMKAMFSQHVSPVQDVTYDIDVYTGQVSPRAILAQQMVHESVKSVFVRHGALRLRTALLAPRTKLLEQSELAVSVMDHSGTLVTLPCDLRVPFARYIARNSVVHMKSTPENLVPDAEVLLSVAEIIKEFPCLASRSYYIRINHAALMKSYLTSIDISDERQTELLAILKEIRSEKDRNVQIHTFVESLQLSEHTATALCEFLDFEGPVNKLREHLIGTMKRKSWVGQTARQSFHDLEAITSHAETFEIGLPLLVNTSMVYNFPHFSGLIFQFVAANKRKRKRGGVDILAAGGRYDKLINNFRRGAEAAHPTLERWESVSRLKNSRRCFGEKR
ncbi:Eukaryotic translation initiation factor 2 alpha kinase 4 [Desmophyllum pertusum]|uniref:Eukaryotic translation initiation factor 2 alpha kinase 4 n=1 Tax=Desmophyllum pertusum TaxID=174260 RepID=A0A9X0DA45_9CNID|nr:Eukaryotic translation initiation factor 2 alpha kinase 4 [Desmophyllum pertusum]